MSKQGGRRVQCVQYNNERMERGNGIGADVTSLFQVGKGRDKARYEERNWFQRPVGLGWIMIEGVWVMIKLESQ